MILGGGEFAGRNVRPWHSEKYYFTRSRLDKGTLYYLYIAARFCIYRSITDCNILQINEMLSFIHNQCPMFGFHSKIWGIGDF